MNKYTKKRRKKYIKQDKKKRTNKRASNFKINRKIEARFKNLDIKTIKELRNKFEKERLLSKSKYIVIENKSDVLINKIPCLEAVLH